MIRRTVALSVLVLLLFPLAACGGSEAPQKSESASDVLALAKKKFDEARSVHLKLSTDSKPSSGDAVLGAEGTLTHQPAFDGEVTVVLSGFNADVPVVSIDDKVYAKLPLTPKYAPINPEEYGAPDPAEFADPDKGVSTLLQKLEGVEKAGRKRVGSQVLTTYTGTLSGDLVAPIIPSASESGTYRTSVGIDDENRIVTLAVTGDFFAHDGDVTYHLVFDDYDKNVTVEAP
jgi:lipoprotein LprG